MNKSLLSSSLLMALLCISPCIWGSRAWAKGWTKIESPEKLTQLNDPFNLSVDPAEGGSGNYSQASISPELKTFYVVITATINLPSEITPVAMVPVRAVRIIYPGGYANRNSGPTPVAPVEKGDAEIIKLYLTQTGQIDANGKRLYTYCSNGGSGAPIASVTPVAGAYDWDITAKLGRWQLQVDPEFGASNIIEFKINKRLQIKKYAEDWAAYYPTRPESTYNALHHDWVYISPFPPRQGDSLFEQCHGFVGYIYNRMGLYPEYDGIGGANDVETAKQNARDEGKDQAGVDLAAFNALGFARGCTTIGGAMDAEDSGVGALRTWTGHSGIIVSTDSMVDDNNPGDDDKRVKVHSLDYMDTVNILRNPPNRTARDPDGAKDPLNPTLPKSWLKELDDQ